MSPSDLVTVEPSVCNMSVFNGPLELFDHGHIQTADHAKLFKVGWLKLPGYPEVCVAVRFAHFQFNRWQNRQDAVFEVRQRSEFVGHYFASAFKSLIL